MLISVRSAQASVKHQYDRPTCVAFAVTALHEHAYDISNGRDRAEIDLSEEFLYYHCKRCDGLRPKCAGTTVSAASVSLAREGQSLEALCPYRTSPHAAQARIAAPSSQAIADGKSRLLSGLMRLPKSISTVRRYLTANSPLVAILDLYSNAYVTRTGRLETPQASDTLLGLHAVLIVELDERRAIKDSSITFKNSWGNKWGDNGFGSFRFDYFEQYCRELWGYDLKRSKSI
jgi:C1A family cysteine protease